MNDCYFEKKDWRSCKKEVSLLRQFSTRTLLPNIRLRLRDSSMQISTIYRVGADLMYLCNRWKSSESAGRGRVMIEGRRRRTLNSILACWGEINIPYSQRKRRMILASYTYSAQSEDIYFVQPDVSKTSSAAFEPVSPASCDHTLDLPPRCGLAPSQHSSLTFATWTRPATVFNSHVHGYTHSTKSFVVSTDLEEIKNIRRLLHYSPP